MIKIGDFSKIARVSIRTLRHYDEIELLKPAHIDASSGYRSYSMEQLPRLSRILFLKELGFSLTEVKTLIDNQLTLDDMKAMLSKRQAELKKEIDLANYNLYAINSRLDMIENEGKLPLYDVTIKKTEGFRIASYRQKVPSLLEMDHYCHDMYTLLYNALERLNMDTSGTEITFYHNDDYVETDIDMEVSVMLPRDILVTQNEMDLLDDIEIKDIESEELVASLMFEGPLCEIEIGIVELIKWLATHDWEINGPGREIHLSGKAHAMDSPEQHVIELQIPIKKISQ